MKTLAAMMLLFAAGAMAQGQAIEYFEVRNQRLFAKIGGEDRIISTSAVRAWQGWTPNILVYSERVDAKQRLRWYDTFTRNSHTVSTEDYDIADFTSVRLSTGEYALLMALRDKNNMPAVALANNAGVFHREEHATYGTAANDAVEIRRFRVEDLERTRGNLSMLQPVAIVSVPLIPSLGSAAGLYELTLPAAGGGSRQMTLNLRPDGSATMITTFTGKGNPVARRGTWKQEASDIRLELDGGKEVLVWTLNADGLTPKQWDRTLYGTAGLAFRKPAAPMQGPRRLPGTVAPLP